MQDWLNDMRLYELFEAKPAKKPVVPTTTPRNFVAKNAPKTGAGSHSDKKYSRKEKHKNNKDLNEVSCNERDISDFL